MPFRATCPFCGATYPDIPDNRLAQKARCTRCSQIFLAQPPDPAVPAALQRAQQLRTRFLRISAIPVDPEIAKALPLAVLERNKAVPVGRAGQDLVVAMVDPGDLMQVDELRRHHPQIKPMLALPHEIAALLASLKEPPKAGPVTVPGQPQSATVAASALANEAMADLERDYDPDLAGDTQLDSGRRPSGPSTPAKVALDNVFAATLRLGGSELRLMPQEERTVVQCRTESGLTEISVDQNVPYHQILARLKDEAGCDPTRRGVEQTGSIPYDHEGKEYEFYLRVLPGRAADLAQLRVLDAAAMRQRRALERRQKVDDALAELARPDWPPEGSGVDPAAAKDQVAADLANKPAAVRLAYAVLFEALDAKSSDLVFEPQKGPVRVLGRSGGGDFTPLMTIPVHAHKPLLARLQIMANIDLAYHNRAQQGCFFLVREGVSQEVRIMSLPTDIGLWLAVHLPKRHG
jgi:type II secretory ATPase GspE/PulE/Tfp pilus assembly ATPase PilB-like protein